LIGRIRSKANAALWQISGRRSASVSAGEPMQEPMQEPVGDLVGESYLLKPNIKIAG
jgi:hypothetical protein